jgi:hypothetical protein
MRLIRSDSRETLGRLYWSDGCPRSTKRTEIDTPLVVGAFSFSVHYSIESAGDIVVAAPITLRNSSVAFDLDDISDRGHQRLR